MKVKNFAGFMKSKLNEDDTAFSSSGGMSDGSMTPYGANFDGNDHNEYGYSDGSNWDASANPEEEEPVDSELEGEEEGEEEEKEVTLEDLKAMIEDLTERVDKLEGGEEEAEGEEEPMEGEEEPAEGEEGAEEETK